MTNALLKTFSFDDSAVRIIVEDGKPLFCGVDVCKILGHTNPSRAIKMHCREDGLTKCYATDEVGRQQEYSFITEGNLYRLIVKSKLESARKFEAWVFDEVLPTIRMTGSYAPQPQPPQIPFNIPKTLPDALRLAADLADKNAALEAQIETDKPKVEFFSRIVQSDTEFCISDVAKMLGYGVQKFFIFLRQKAWMWQHEYRARSEVCTEGYMAMRVTEKNGKQYSQPVFLGKGIFKIYRMMLKDGLIERNPQIEMSMK